MAGPSIAVRVIGDLSGFAKSMGDTATQGQNVAGKLHSAFTGAMGAINAIGFPGLGEALDGIDQAVGRIAEHGKQIGPMLTGVGAAMVGVGAGLTALGSKDQAAQQQLQSAIEATGHSYDDYSDRVEQAVKHNEHFGDTANQTKDALRILTQATGDPTKALDDMSVATDLAAAKHEDLTTASTQLARMLNGNGKLLKEYGISQKDAAGATKSHDEILKELSDKLQGQASAAADTFGGKLKSLKATVEDSVASFGQKYGPAITAAGAAMTALGTAVQLASVAQGILNVVTAAWPIFLIIAAVAAFAAGIIWAYQNVGWFRAAVQAFGAVAVAVFYGVLNTVQVVFGWIVDHWQLLLTILTGPIGAAVWIITSHWESIKNGVMAVIGFITDHWQIILDILTAPFRAAVWAISAAWGPVEGFLSDVPHWLSIAFSTVEDIVKAPFVAAFNAVKTVWNDTLGGFGFDTPDWLGPLGGKHFGIPKMQHGGIVTQPTLALVGEAGPEAVIPLNRAAATTMGAGPVVNIEHATFAQEMDVDLFMKRVAWHTQTAAV